MAYQEITAEKVIPITSKEALLLTFDMTDYLAPDETIADVSGTDAYGVTLGITVPAAITLATSAIVNTSAISQTDGDDIAIGKAIQAKFRTNGATLGKTYDTHWVFLTSKGSTREAVLTLKAVG